MIFLSITGSWTAALLYDRREKKRVQKKWTTLVEHIAKEPMDAQSMPRKLTVYLQAPPSDGLMVARDHFKEYVKPILVAAAVDWDAVEGRMQGDIRAGAAEKIRRIRKRRGEASVEPLEDDAEEVLEQTRERMGVKPYDGPAGDIVIGRNTWKEYIRGIHEGWLGPLDPPGSPPEAIKEDIAEVVSSVVPDVPPAAEQPPSAEFVAETPSTTPDDASPTATTPPLTLEPEKPAEAKPDEKKPSKKKQPPPFNTTADYPTAVLSPNCPPELQPTTTVPFPHLLGIRHTPVRMYRFLTRRYLADDIGRQTAAAVLAVYRPYEAPGESRHFAEDGAASSESNESERPQWEQERLLKHEEKEWHKSVREPSEEGKERVWMNDMVLDPRIAERMRKFELDMEQEERAKRIAAEKEDPWWKSAWRRMGEKEEDLD
jgi:import inner membrane translocase subunit TIM54